MYDPDGQDDQGKGGGKIIDVFIAIPPEQRGTDYRTVNGKRTGEISTPNWSKLVENAAKEGVTVNVTVLSGSDVSGVRTSREAGHDTVIIGHGLDLHPDDSSRTKFTADAAGLSDGYVGVGGTTRASLENGNYSALGPATPLNQPAGGVVGLFTCNSTDVLANAFPGQTVVSNDGGRDGLTTLGTLEQAGFGFVGTLADTGNANAAMNTGQGVIDRRSNFVVLDPSTQTTQIGTNQGDRLHIRKPENQ